MTSGRSRCVNTFALVGFSIASMAMVPDCARPDRQPTLTCADFELTFSPGTCAMFTNPCDDNRWLDPSSHDGFGLLAEPGQTPAPITIVTDQSHDMTVRSMCAAEDVIFTGRVPFRYTRVADFGEGHARLVVVPSVRAWATPERVNVGQSSQLAVEVVGGVKPYRYSWTGDASLDALNRAMPVASPLSTRTYTVEVTSATDVFLGTASVTVAVSLDIEITADPPVVAVSFPSRLLVYAAGGVPPYQFSWTPAELFDDPTFRNPFTRPLTTTTEFTLTMVDSKGDSRTGSVEVAVELTASPTAAPETIDIGQTTRLDARPGGGDGQYRYRWSPVDGLSDPTIRNPAATPGSTTTYTVTVTDGHGLSATGQVPVTVRNASTLTPSFTFRRGALDASAHTIHWTFDASASTGSIASYTWDLYDTANTLIGHSVTTTPMLDIDLPEAMVRGSATLTLIATDGQTATVTRSFR